jgi:HAD superfamily hydrolase (TIGR01549 family)
MGTTIQALTFDWYGTLATHRGKGRRQLFAEYLAGHDLQSAPWDRRVLFEGFAYYSNAYNPEFTDDDKLVFWTEFTRRLFERSQVHGSTANRTDLHAPAIRDIFGSSCFQLYPDVQPVLGALKQKGFRLAVISNWHGGLDSFCFEMNLSAFLDAVIASADIGIEKPDGGIFNEAVRRLDVAPSRIAHIGDLPNDDFSGAVGAGFNAILIDRGKKNPTHPNRIESLLELERGLQLIEDAAAE